MIVSARPLSTGNLGALFALNAGDLKLIRARVKACIAGKVAVDRISQKLPAFRQALVVAQQWNDTLVPQLVALSRQVDAYAEQAIEGFSVFNEQVKKLGPDVDELPVLL